MIHYIEFDFFFKSTQKCNSDHCKFWNWCHVFNNIKKVSNTGSN